MSLEATLTRTFEITFIDARNLVVEAKVSLGIEGYPNAEQKDKILLEAFRIYDNKSHEVRQSYKDRRMSLDSVKSSNGSCCSSVADLDEYMDNDSGHLSVASGASKNSRASRASTKASGKSAKSKESNNSNNSKQRRLSISERFKDAFIGVKHHNESEDDSDDEHEE